LPIIEDGIRAGPKRNNFLYHLQEIAQLTTERIRPKIAGTIIAALPNEFDARPLGLLIHTEREICSIIFKPNIVSRLVLRDQVPLEKEGLLLCLGDYGLETNNPTQEVPDLKPSITAGKIGPHSSSKILCLSDVDDLSVLVLHEIDTREFRDERYLTPKRLKPNCIGAGLHT
jgi:hypothetical protein